MQRSSTVGTIILALKRGDASAIRFIITYPPQAFEALEGLTSTFSEVIVLNRLVVHGDPAATATDARYLLSGPDRHCSF